MDQEICLARSGNLLLDSSLETWKFKNLMGVIMRTQNVGSVREGAAARTAQAITASGETRRPAVVDKIKSAG